MAVSGQDVRPRSPPRGPPHGEEDVKYSRRSCSHGYEGATAAAPDLDSPRDNETRDEDLKLGSSLKCSVVSSRFRSKALCDDPFKGVQNRLAFLHPSFDKGYRKDGKRDHPNCNNCGSASHEAKACFMRPSSSRKEEQINATSSSKEEEINPKDVERRPDEEEPGPDFLFQFSLQNEHVRARGGGGLEFAQAGQRQHVLSWDHPWDSRSYYPPELSSKKRLQKGNYKEEGYPLITRDHPREKIESLVSRSDYPREFSSGKRLQKGSYKEEEYPRVKKDMGQVKRLEKGRNYKEEEEYPRVKKDMGQVVHKMLSKMGYKERQGLGKDEQDMKEPLIATGNEGRLGIGAKRPRE
ncbi:unnamed protein product [Arabidopsis arenosa]|uniref:G-patch domain-containing protein n=1 Tax=Arabidopsis arenosa TaxID=38785 RepID=A0A8S1ZNI2_ARAAE|nr:unnamed protein product [Arabidopsis arenosa]